MHKDLFLRNVDTQNFVAWLCNLIDGSIPLDFKYANGSYRSLEETILLYAWPPKRTDIPTPLGQKTMIKNSSLSDNEELLSLLSVGLRNSVKSGSDSEISNWVQAILVWGGVYTMTKTGKGNAGWLEDYRLNGGIGKYLSQSFMLLNEAEDDEIGRTITNLRSNAGLTKIYALGCDNFVIYDSRVAAALSWLISKWSRSAKAVPEHLRFATMRANTSKKGGKQRTADETAFPYFAPTGTQSAHVKHLKWNIRANWLLEQAISNSNIAKTSNSICSIRDLEASLFVIGDNLQNAKKFI
jgi:hypothetical protein